MRSVAALRHINSLSINRLLRKQAVERFNFGAKIFLSLCCLVLALWSAKSMVQDVLRTGQEVTKLSNNINDKLAKVNENPTAQRKNIDYGRIGGQQIFGKVGVVEAPAAPPLQTAPVSNVSLKLIGTYVATGQDPTAIIEDSKKPGSQDVFAIGESIFGEAKLLAVHPDRVEIDRNGKREILTLDESVSGGGGGAAEAGGNTIVVDEAELDTALSNLPMLLTQARAVPYFKDGKSIGLRLFAIRRGSLFEKIGLQNGDILKEINGQSLSDITQAVKLFEKLKEQRDIAVSLERQREEQTYRYLIR